MVVNILSLSHYDNWLLSRFLWVSSCREIKRLISFSILIKGKRSLHRTSPVMEMFIMALLLVSELSINNWCGNLNSIVSIISGLKESEKSFMRQDRLLLANQIECSPTTELFNAFKIHLLTFIGHLRAIDIIVMLAPISTCVKKVLTYGALNIWLDPRQFHG